MPAPEEDLIAAARQAAKYAVSGYSGFRVGVALKVKDGPVVTGCNIENSTLNLSICAERVAIFKALSEGHTQFTDLVITSSAEGELCPPCGACRQLIWEFAPEVRILLVGSDDSREAFTPGELLPRPFDASYLG